MADKTPKTERMNINPSTVRMSVDSTPTSSGDFTGSLKSGEVIKGYTVQNLISAQSGEAEIYLCIKENKQAIIKYYHPQFSPKEDILKKFHNLKHPDIITIFEYGKHNGRFYEIMEYAAGGTLADKRADSKYKYLPMSESKVRKVVSEVINAFKYLHQQGIIHRDIKPGNIFYKNTNGSDILIGDFGISSELDVDGGMSKRMTSTIALSEGYAAPELYGVAKDDNKAKVLIGPEVDYYALGITVYELLTGTNPFSGRNALHIMRDTMEGRVADDLLSRPEAKSFSPAINTLIRGLLVVRHDKRWKYDEVSKWLNGEDVQVFNDIRIATIPPLKFGDAQITSKEELAAALRRDAELGKKYLNRGMIDNWAMKYDESFANSIIDIKESDMSDGDKLSSLIFLLDPSAPCRVSTSILINTIPEFIELLRNESELMSKIIIDRQDSDLLAWINTQSSDLYKEISKLSELFKRNPDKTDQSKLRMIYDLYINLAGDSIKPFRQNDYTVRTVNDIANVPEELQKAVVKQLLKNSSSILSQWLKNQNVTDFETVRNEMVHTWENWHAFFSDKLVKFENNWISIEEKNNALENKAKVEMERRVLQQKALRKKNRIAAFVAGGGGAIFILLIIFIVNFISVYNDPSIRTFAGHSDKVTAIAFSPDGKYAISGSYDKTLRLWDISNENKIKVFRGHTSEIITVAFSPDGKQVISGSLDRTMRLWNVSSGEEIRAFRGHTGEISEVALSPDGKYLISGSTDKTLRLWDVSTGNNLQIFYGHQEMVTAAAFSSNGNYTLSGSSFEGKIIVWNIVTGKIIRTIATNTARAIEFSSDGQYAIVLTRDRSMKVLNTSSGKIVRSFELLIYGDDDTVALSPDSKYALSGAWMLSDNTIKLWDISMNSKGDEYLEPIRIYRGHAGGVLALAFSPDGQYLLSASEDKTIKLYEQ